MYALFTASENTLPKLSGVQCTKLRHLTIVSLAIKNKVCHQPYVHLVFSTGRLVPDFDYFKSSWSWTLPDLGTQIRSKPDLDLGRMFWDHRTICLMKIMPSPMLSAAIKRQYSSVLPLSRHCLSFFDRICRMAMGFVFLSSK